jgi:hypothetical protein
MFVVVDSGDKEDKAWCLIKKRYRSGYFRGRRLMADV